MFDTKMPKYSKIEVILKDKSEEIWNDGLKSSVPQKTHYTFEDAGLVITGNSLIIVIDGKNEIDDTLSSTGKIFDLKDVATYKTYNE